MKPRVDVIGVGVVTPLGLSWRGLAASAADPPPLRTSTELAASHPGTPAREIGAIAAGDDAGDARQRKLMSRPARFAAIAARRALEDAGRAAACDDIGFFLGVGPSAPPIAEVTALVGSSLDDGRFSFERCGRDGLFATNPLFAFQILNNFTMCHGAILCGTRGPNATYFSRGAGTVTALASAIAAIEDGDCDVALAGGADSALHPLAWAELCRDGFAARGLVPGEGAAVLVLARADVTNARALAKIERAHVGACAIADAARGCDVAVTAPWGDPARESLAPLHAELPPERVVDAARAFGESLAAAPAIAWATAVDAIVSGAARRAVALSAGIDGEVGAVVLARGDA